MQSPLSRTEVNAFRDFTDCLTPFGFYRLWMAIILVSPQFFYGFDKDSIPQGSALDADDLDPRFLAGNVKAGFGYLCIGSVPLVLDYYIH